MTLGVGVRGYRMLTFQGAQNTTLAKLTHPNPSNSNTLHKQNPNFKTMLMHNTKF
jgi:hypothetical protein